MGLSSTDTSKESSSQDLEKRAGCCRCCSSPKRCNLSGISTWGPIAWFKKLRIIGQLRLGGVILSCFATCLVVIAISTEFWIKRFIRGILLFRGLWKDCRLGKCSLPQQMPSYIVISIFFMMISLVTCYGSVIFGTLSLTVAPPPKRATWHTLTINMCFVSGFTAGIGLFNFMRVATLQPNTFLSWSLVPGWFSVIAVSMAGVCHFVATSWEEDEIAEKRWATTTIFTLQQDWVTSEQTETKKT